MKKRIVCLIFIAALLFSAAASYAEPGVPVTATEGKRIRILFTSDMHDYFVASEGYVDGQLREHGGAARLKTLIDLYSDESTVVLDAGDFSMGTLLSAGYATDASELRIMGALGIEVTTFGNHEWDFGPEGVSAMLSAAKACGSKLPVLVESSLSFEGELSEEQQMILDKYDEGMIQDYAVLERGGLKIAVFGVMGYNAVECSPTSGQNWIDYKIAAADMVSRLEEEVSPDLVVCLSHSGTESDGQTGEDIDLINEVPGIDVVISGHSHTVYKSAVQVNDTVLGSCGEYNDYLGLMDISVTKDGPVQLLDYKLIPCDEKVAEDEFLSYIEEQFKASVSANYLSRYGYSFDRPICHSNFNTISLPDMYASSQEYTTGDMIADAYLFEARTKGIQDIDVALVALGTIRGSVTEGYLTAADAFRICSLGVGSDGTAGHPLVTAYLTGAELKLLTELDASLGPYVPDIRMSYAGLNYRFNTKRIPLDRVTTVGLARSSGMLELLEDGMLYKVCCNMYAANMLGMVNGLTKGFLTITPKYADGTPVEDFYDCVLTDGDGEEIKEWVALADYWSSFRMGEFGLPEVPLMYLEPQNRKVAYAEGGFDRINNPGRVTLLAVGAGFAVLVIVLLIVTLIRRAVHRAAKQSAAAKAAKAAKAKEAKP